jgi:hypothetical protein
MDTFDGVTAVISLRFRCNIRITFKRTRKSVYLVYGAKSKYSVTPKED